MTKSELIKDLERFNDDDVVIVGDIDGWSNIDYIKQEGSSIKILMERFPLFSDN